MTSFTWLPDAAWRGALLLAIAFIVARLLRGQPAAVRHVLWTGTLAGVMAMPILAAVAPVVPVTVPQRVLQRSSPVASDNSLGSSESVAVQADKQEDRGGAPTTASGSSDLGSAIQAVTTPWYRWFTPVTWAVIIWLAGVAFFSIRLLVGFLALGRANA